MKKEQSIIQATVLLVIMTIIGKGIGFVRQSVIAAFYGATAETDAFFFAQGLPWMIFPAISDSIAMTFMTFYINKTVTSDKNTADKYASSLINAVLIGAALLSLVGALLAPIFVSVLAPGFVNTQRELATELSRIAMISFLFQVAKYMFGAILNSKKMFFQTAFAGIIYNTIIIVMTFFWKNNNVFYLMYSVILGDLAQLFFIGYQCMKGFKYNLIANPLCADVKSLLRVAYPMILGNTVAQMNGIVDSAVGSVLEEGSLSALSYANSLKGIVVAVIIGAVSTAIFPTLVEKAVMSEKTDQYRVLLIATKGALMLVLPLICVVMCASDSIVRVVYGRGGFGEVAVNNTAIVLLCYAPQFLFIAVQEVLSRGFWAKSDTKVPAISSVIGTVTNVLLSIIGAYYFGLKGIALATSISVVISSSMLIYMLGKSAGTELSKGIIVSVIKLVIIGMMICLLYRVVSPLLVWSNDLLKIICISVGILLVYVMMLMILENKTMKLLRESIRRRTNS